MRDSLLLPFYVAGMFLLIFLLLTGGMLMYLWNVHYVTNDPPGLRWLVYGAPAAMHALFPLAVIAALFLSFIRLAHAPGIPALSFLLSLLASGALLYFGYPLLTNLSLGSNPPVERSDNPLVAGYFNTLESETIYPQSVKGFEVGRMVIANGSSGPALLLGPAASYDPARSELRTANGETTPVVPPNPTYSPIFAPPPLLSAFGADLSALNRDLERSYESPRLHYPIECGGLLLLAMGCFLFARITRWPLLNAFLVIAAFRGLFWLNALLDSPATARVAEPLLPKELLSSAPAIALGGAGVILIVLQLLLVRDDSR